VDCTFNTSQCTGGYCGDDQVNGLEPCDGADVGGMTCAALGYLGEVVPLGCTDECAFSGASCTCGGVLCAEMTETCVLEGGGIYSCQSA
jgi:hypothetical protein